LAIPTKLITNLIFSQYKTETINMKKSLIKLSIICFGCLILLNGCRSAFEKCVEAKQDEYKKENPNENYEKLVRERELHERECQDLR
jgi:hypothetical protein